MNSFSKTLFIPLSFLFISQLLLAQKTDTTDSKIPESWKKFNLGLRLGIGWQKRFAPEFGLALQRYAYDARHGYIVPTIYASFEWDPAYDQRKALYGFKAGYEMASNTGTGAIEVKYLTDSGEEDVMITPKIGFGLGFLNIFYGYNFSTNKYPFPNVGRHQFNLVINSNIFFYEWKRGGLK